MATKAVTFPNPNPLDTSPLAKAALALWRSLRARLSARATRAPERVLAVEDRVALGPKKSLVVVRCHGQRFLVGVSPDSVGPFVEVGGSPAAEKQALKRSDKPARRRIHTERIS